MKYSIFRNGKDTRDSFKQLLKANMASIIYALAVPWALVRTLDIWANYSDTYVTVSLWIISFVVWLLYYSYVTATRVLPLAEITGDNLTIRTGILGKKNIDLLNVTKITFQYYSEHDQRMRVKSPGEIPVEFKIKQTNCNVEDLGKFLTRNHEIDVSYS